MAEKFKREISAEMQGFFGESEVDKKKGVNWQLWQLREKLEAKEKEHEEYVKSIRDREDKTDKELRSLRKKCQDAETELKNFKDKFEAQKKNEERLTEELKLAKERVNLVMKELELVRNREELLKKQLIAIEEKTAQDSTSRTLMKEINQEVRELLQKQKTLEKELISHVDKTMGISDKVNSVFTQAKLVEEEKHRINITVPPPTGDVTLVFTDVQGSTTQWEKFPDIMAKALRVHNDLIRSTFAPFGGYEVKTEGDAFMISFSNTIKAVRWCVQTQEKLLQANWPQELYSHPDSAIEEKNGILIWKGLRVRMGVHCGNPSCEPDPVTGRMDYFGPMVNRSARVEGTANGGQIMCSGDVWDKIKDNLQEVGKIEFRDMGFHRLKGLEKDTRIIEILPSSLKTRNFPMYGASSQPQERSKKLSEKIEVISQENNQLRSKLSSIQNEFNEQKKLASILLEKLKNLQKNASQDAVMVVIENVEELINNHDKIKDEILEIKTNNENLTSEVVLLQSNIEELRIQVNSLTEHNNAIMKESTTIREELGETKKKFTGDISELKEKLESEHKLTLQAREEKSKIEDDIMEIKEKLIITKASLYKLLDKGEAPLEEADIAVIAQQCQNLANSIHEDYVIEKKPFIQNIGDYLKEVADAAKKFVNSIEDEQDDYGLAFKLLYRMAQITLHNLKFMKNLEQSNELKEYLQNLLTASSYYIYVRNKSKESTNIGQSNQIVDVAYGSVKESLGLMLKTIRAAAFQQGVRPEASANKAKEELQVKLESAVSKSEEYISILKTLSNQSSFDVNLFSQTIREAVNVAQSIVEFLINEELIANLVKHTKILLQKGAELRQEQNPERRKRFEEAAAQFENAMRHTKVFALLS